MGCGGSTLKGDEPDATGVSNVPAKPVKKPATNFNTVDYANSATNHKPSMATAPDEIHPVSQETNKVAAEQKDGEHVNLAPYKSLTTDEPSQSPTMGDGSRDGLGETGETPDMIR